MDQTAYTQALTAACAALQNNRNNIRARFDLNELISQTDNFTQLLADASNEAHGAREALTSLMRPALNKLATSTSAHPPRTTPSTTAYLERSALP
ncbi:hypothetical protein [Mycolicibacterium fortuitum]|uniref:hypothetical protein n=1 Tax=Mycolicibacterium fortuitum TaxID=1766 RepID=UPI001CE08FFC|nr:hypothetical protein [Mycolicibacterium fortuitum]MCA4727426.1 hypothetical protein [Mycolicibacterium fortuitum]